ncbi:MAG: heavy-metal-associated domain-containing protein [Planctomycetota bacterium]|jgi:copper chaperone
MFKPFNLSCIVFIASLCILQLSFSALQACAVIPKKACCEEAGIYDTKEYKEGRIIQVSCTVCENVEKHPNKKDVTLEIKGMTCGGCESKVKAALSACKGVSDVNVSHKDGKADFHLEDGNASVEEVMKAVRKLGYKVTKG